MRRTTKLPTEVEAAGGSKSSQCPREATKLPMKVEVAVNRRCSTVYVRLQSFPTDRWLRQLAAVGASNLPKHNSEKEGKKRYLYLLSQQHDSNKRSTQE